MQLRHVVVALFAGTVMVAQAVDERRAGDLLSLALPLGALTVELSRGDQAGGWQLGQTVALSTGLTELLKRTTHVRRPDGLGDTSFPSGHAARAFSAAAYVHQRHGLERAWPLYLAATYVGHTRVQARRHRWSEVAASAGLAYGVAAWRVQPLGAQVRVAVADRGAQIELAWRQ